MSTNTSNEGAIRKAIIEADLVDCMIALPGQLFYTTQIPVCLWFLRRHSSRPGQTLFIDARKLGHLVDRTHRELSDEEIARIADTYHAWRREENNARTPGRQDAKGENNPGDSAPLRLGVEKYEDIPGFCKSATIEKIREHGYVLTPGRYVGAAAVEDDGIPFEEKMAALSAEWRAQVAEARKLDQAIERNLAQLGWETGT